ncbi:hypothetical protein E2C01_075434 [Portunus trituberculatus]|uniref:Uncharacterized protein n=1 Tax=Portunus trituberculatus TaxID=210409 RepID=A0A5B7IAP4_PORTR|nr:hypothetical protein [Portunus trituberculatus]
MSIKWSNRTQISRLKGVPVLKGLKSPLKAVFQNTGPKIYGSERHTSEDVKKT